MLTHLKIFLQSVREGLQIAMERKSKLIRKRKLSCRSKDVVIIEANDSKQRKTMVEEFGKQKTEKQTNGLHSKSVLQFDNGKQKSFLLFLASQQTVAVQGKVQLEALKGTMDISGFKFKPNSQANKLFSPNSQSLLTVRECSEENGIDNNLDSGLKMRNILSSLSTKIKKGALARADKASSVLLLDGFQSLEMDFICQYKEYAGIFTKELQEEDFTPSEKLIHEMTSPYGFTLLEADDRYSTYKQPKEWNDIITDITESITATNNGENPAILICGGKGVGKSTFARTVINSLLNSCREVCYLECDVGQTELTPPAILSLNCISKSLLGPPFTHLQWPKRAYFYGDVSPKDNPDLYINSISSLYNHYRKYLTSRPLVINTQGWVKGFGIPLLMDVIRITQPTRIVQINSNQATKNLPTITREFLDLSPGWAWPVDGQELQQQAGNLIKSLKENGEQKDVHVSDIHHKSYPTIYQINAWTDNDQNSSSTLRPADYRAMSTLAYLSNALQSLQVDSLLHCKPYKVPWSKVAVHVNQSMVPRSQLLVSLNASIVGLAVCPSAVLDEHDSKSGLPRFIQETPIAECVGLGIMRNIDPVNQLFYIITPVPLAQLQRVNTLLKGGLEIPAPLLLRVCTSCQKDTARPEYEVVRHEMWHLSSVKIVSLLQSGHSGAPYLSSEFSYDIKGAGARKVRYNLQRKKFNSPARPDL